ncbi:hypothetical protein GCM10009785_25410 [Brooklawnia cerclae]|uniref:Outer membrane channel protein CpnT-like N-terminal domain-containing protein n=1 Tax=Brooklawnia cerclae TaxID=349934 RepID=A0ABX0SBU2_9ACTN|nr:hypothetical protein [Brooklawnia cerclae]NIH55495.1 hypothetical protein [Brooklawnia cerclae]
MAIILPAELVTALQYLGYEWPSSNEDVLNANADAFTQARTVAATAADDVEAAIAYVARSNSGEACNVFVSYMLGDESNLSSLRDFDEASGLIADGFHVIAGVVVVLKSVVIAELIILAAAIAAAVGSGGLAAGAVVLAREAAKRLVDMAIGVAIEQVLGG